jgi:glutamate dehydrogenase/leucine dehydrogenase
MKLRSVEGFIVFDLPGAALSAGGTRLAPDVSVEEVTLLARAMTYKFAVLHESIGGAKAGIRADPADPEARAETMARYVGEIRPMTDAGRFLTGPDMGTFEEDFAALRDREAIPAAIRSEVGDVRFEDLLTGFGVAVSAETALRDFFPNGWVGRSAAVEGFGKVGGGVAREVTRRGGRVLAISTITGCIVDPGGLDVERLFALRAEHGDRCLDRYGLPVGPPTDVFRAEADVLVPGARTGSVTGSGAGSVAASVRVVAPAANVPYTTTGLKVLRERGIVALADFVCNAGAVIGYRSSRQASPEQILSDVERRITDLTKESSAHPDGPFAGASAMAGEFLRTWWGDPPAPPLAAG